MCFCTFLGGQPFPAGGYDLNLSPLLDGFLVEAGSACGTTLLDRARALLAETSPEHIEARDRARAAARAKVDQNVAQAGLRNVSDLRERVRNSRSNPLWERLAQECVECAACNFICPTCHCFLLVDVEERQGFRRFKDWDACLYRAFALEAAGANPRPRRADRLHGRLEKKFDFLVANAGTWGCVGCGRCIEACAGRIDLRETLRELIHA